MCATTSLMEGLLKMLIRGLAEAVGSASGSFKGLNKSSGFIGFNFGSDF